MANMRLKLNLRGMALKYDSYTWGGIDWGEPAAVGNNINYLTAMDDRISFLSDTHCYASRYQRQLQEPQAETVLWTDKYIYPLFLKPIMVLDGTVFGQLRYGLAIVPEGTGTITLTKMEITLKKIDSSGNETDLASTHTISPAWAHTTTTITYASFPFFFHVEDQKVNMQTNRLLFEVKPYGSTTLDSGGMVGNFYRATAINTNEQSMILPVV